MTTGDIAASIILSIMFALLIGVMLGTTSTDKRWSGYRECIETVDTETCDSLFNAPTWDVDRN